MNKIVIRFSLILGQKIFANNPNKININRGLHIVRAVNTITDQLLDYNLMFRRILAIDICIEKK